MAARGKLSRGETQLGFEALSIEGGLLSPDWLSRVAQLQAGHQSEANYRVPKGLNLRDEIGRYWRIAQAHWADFAAGRASGGDAAALAERFVVAVLRDSFGFTSLAVAEPFVLTERSYPIGFSAVGGRVPVVIAPAGSGLDSLTPAFGDGTRRRSAFGLAQEYLNAADDAQWGLASDGVTLRILRDNASLTRPAWVEADLARIFTEERFADFAALWLLAHETRFGTGDEPKRECALEMWRDAGREEGTRAREYLRRGVEEALLALGQGFLGHPQNQALRGALQDGTLTTTAFFQQLLRLIYRLIFVLTVEERGLLHPEETSKELRRTYAEGYSLRRLRDRSVRRSAHDRFSDLWEATKIVFRSLASGEPRLALPALAGIFATGQCPALDEARLENRSLLLAVFRLAWLREASGLSRVNWRDMGPEELGSVYESLLELVPQVAKDGRQFAFAMGGEAQGHARKTTGSYYTPDSLVQVLLDSALEPVIARTIAKNPEKPVEALLGLAIVDPACGSGHFLLAAARRLASHVARLQANGTPSAAEYRHAIRQVVGRCVYGVDLNLMAVELCKVSLWMEAVEPGLPLTFLNSHIQHGNALLGTTPELMTKGIPDAAWEPIEGDDKKTASALRKRNNKAAEGQRSLETFWSKESDAEAQAVARAVAELEVASDTNPEALAKKESHWDGILGSAQYRHQKFVADAWCAAFVWPKQARELADAAPTNELWRQLRDEQGQAPALTVKYVSELAELYRFFHWQLQFPHVFLKGGFDVVLGNPPWEMLQIQEAEFFVARIPELAASKTRAARQRLIDRACAENPPLRDEFVRLSRVVAGQRHFIAESGRFEFSAAGRINLYKVMLETGWMLLSMAGRLGMIVPSGIATDDFSAPFFAEMMESRALVSLYDFENRQGFFPSVDSRMRFCLLTLGSRQHGRSEPAQFAFFLQSTNEAQEPDRVLRLTANDLRLLNPNTASCPIFRSVRDLAICKRIYAVMPVLVRDTSHGPVREWGVQFGRIFNLGHEGDAFQPVASLSPDDQRDRSKWLPLFEGKMFGAYDHRAGSVIHNPDNVSRPFQSVDTTEQDKKSPTFEVSSQFYLAPGELRSRVHPLWPRGWLIAAKDVTAATNERTVIACILPMVPTSYSVRVVLGDALSGEEGAFFVAMLNSVVYDWVIRQFLGGLHLQDSITKQSPVVPRAALREETAWCAGDLLGRWVGVRVLELSFTSDVLGPFADDAGYEGPAFRWDRARRFLLRCELDAAFFHLYGFSRDDTAYVMDSFPILKRNDEQAVGEYITKRTILEIFDAMTDAARTGKPYKTLLDPPPADPRVAHAVGSGQSERARTK